MKNIVYIMADDLGYHDVGYSGSEIKTPNIDYLATNGVILDRFYTLPVCSPARAALMTGYLPIRYGMQHYVLRPGFDTGVPLNYTFLPQKLKSKGYKTHMVGKHHLGYYNWDHTPTFRGFDSFFGYYNGDEDYYSHTFYKGYDLRNDSRPRCGPGCSITEYRYNGTYITYLHTKQVVDIVKSHDTTEPLFLYFSFHLVHAPDQVPKKYVAPYKNISNRERRLFAGMLSCLDESIGNLTRALKEKK